MIRAGGAAIFGVAMFLTGAGSLYVLQQSCQKKPTKVEARTDTVLAQDTTEQRLRRQAEARVRERDREAAKLRARSDSQVIEIKQAKARSDSLEAWARSMAQLPAGITPGDSIIRLSAALEAQKRAAAQLHIVIARQDDRHLTDSVRLAEADSEILTGRQDLAHANARTDTVTKALSDLREETKHKGELRLLGIHLPGWADDVAEVAAAVTLTLVIDRRTRKPEPNSAAGAALPSR